MRLALYDKDPDTEESRIRVQQGFADWLASLQANTPENPRDRHRRVIQRANAYWDQLREEPVPREASSTDDTTPKW